MWVRDQKHIPDQQKTKTLVSKKMPQKNILMVGWNMIM